MIDIVIEAYENKIKEIIPLDKKIKNMDICIKGWLVVLAAGLLAVIIISFLTNPTVAMITMCIYVVCIYVVTNILIRRLNTRWEHNLRKYYEKLDVLRDILQDVFNMYEKNKIKQLIRKINSRICEMKEKEQKKSSDASKFLSLYILPIIAFFAADIYSGNNQGELLAACIVAIYLVIVIRIFVYAINSLMVELEGNQLERKRLFVAQLQDLLDRDFEITEEDLL